MKGDAGWEPVWLANMCAEMGLSHFQPHEGDAQRVAERQFSISLPISHFPR